MVGVEICVVGVVDNGGGDQKSMGLGLWVWLEMAGFGWRGLSFSGFGQGGDRWSGWVVLSGGQLLFPSQLNATLFLYCLVDRDSDRASTRWIRCC